jgi:sugar lactone lactonase YvrE
MDWLISTSASETSTMETNMHPVAGSLFVTKVEVKGLPESRFKDTL